MLSATTLLYVGLASVGAGVVPFAIVSVGIGLGYTFYSGAMEAWLVDALHATSYQGLLDRASAMDVATAGTPSMTACRAAPTVPLRYADAPRL